MAKKEPPRFDGPAPQREPFDWQKYWREKREFENACDEVSEGFRMEIKRILEEQK